MTIQKEKYKFKAYSKEFPRLFEMEKARLLEFLPKDTQIEHIGSSAVPGLGGKGIIDTALGVPKQDIKKAKSKLINKGYDFRESGGDKERLFFQKDYNSGDKTRRVHIQLTFKDSKTLERYLAVRDYLINHKEELKEYVKIKKEGSKIAKGESTIYRKHKNQFLKALEKKALKEHKK